MAVHSISDYRKACVYVRELEKAIRIIKATQAALKTYDKYRPVFHILTTIDNELQFLEIFLEQNQAVVDSKGKKPSR